MKRRLNLYPGIQHMFHDSLVTRAYLRALHNKLMRLNELYEAGKISFEDFDHCINILRLEYNTL